MDLGVVLRGELAEAEEVDHFQAESVPDRLETAIACEKMVENATAERKLSVSVDDQGYQILQITFGTTTRCNMI